MRPLEASHDHLLITPPSHFIPQKVRGWVGRFFDKKRIAYSANISKSANSVKRIFMVSLFQ